MTSVLVINRRFVSVFGAEDLLITGVGESDADPAACFAIELARY